MGFNFSKDTLSENVLEKAGVGAKTTVVGRMVNCIYRKPDTGFGVYEIETEDYHRIKVVGVFPSKIGFDLFYEFCGKVAKKDGELQLEVESYKKTFPTSPTGIMGILSTLSGLNTQAQIVYKTLGAESLQLIHDNPKEVAKRLPGVSLKRAMLWQKELSASDDVERSIPVLMAMGFNLSKAKRLIEEFGPDVGERIQADPYFLVSKGGYVSFKECDKVALANGTSVDDLFRIVAAMTHILRSAAYTEGHCYLTKEDFYERVSDVTGISIGAKDAVAILNQAKDEQEIARWKRYGVVCEINLAELKTSYKDWSCSKKRRTFKFFAYRVPLKKIEEARTLALSQKIMVEEEILGRTVYLLDYIYQAECDVAAAIHNIQASDMPLPIKNKPVIEKYLNANHITLEKKQMDAVRNFTSTNGGFHVLQGVAGGGKTFTLNVIIKVMQTIYRMQGRNFNALILAPTGKAAKVASNATGLPASTIHKALHLVGDETAASDVDLYADCIIVDEFSMVDIFLAKKLLLSIHPTSKVIIIGDSNQLPSIGPGNVLHDIVTCGKVDTVTLSVVKRQATGSGILINANRILHGESIQTEMPGGGEENAGIVRHFTTPVLCRDAIVKEYVRLANQGISINDIQVLCPQKKTEVGTDVLNLLIQKAVLPENNGCAIPIKEVSYMNGEDAVTETLFFRKGDKVIHTENNYQMGWYHRNSKGRLVKDENRKGIINGEMGIIVNTAMQVSDDGESVNQVVVKYDDGYVLYQAEELNQLQHAYAMTIHKSQGSQWPVTITPIMNCNYTMLARNLLYTDYTRASKTNFVFGQAEAIEHAISNTSFSERNSSLAYRI